MMPICFRPLVRSNGPRPPEALSLAGGPLWFDSVALHEFGQAPKFAPVSVLPETVRLRLTAPRAPICGLGFERPRLMGILNVTPDSFSDGGRHLALEDALAQAQRVVEGGADIIDIGGESTRPGADEVPEAEEIARVVPVIRALRAGGIAAPVSVDTRKAAVARAAFEVGADLFNDVSALTHDAHSLGLAAERGMPVCLMHARGDPKTMQDAPEYDDVLLEVYHALEGMVRAAEAAGISRSRILVDPGIGFGKTLEHNLVLLRNLSIIHGLGCPILLGVSRKRFIGTIAGEAAPDRRMPGSIAVALEAVRQGVQVLRIHDVTETRQAVSLWEALNGFTQEA